MCASRHTLAPAALHHDGRPYNEAAVASFVGEQVVECLRRLLLTGLLVFAMPDTPAQVAFGCMFAFLR